MHPILYLNENLENQGNNLIHSGWTTPQPNADRTERKQREFVYQSKTQQKKNICYFYQEHNMANI